MAEPAVSDRRRLLAVLLLCLCGGLVDLLTFTLCDHAFASLMSGNLIYAASHLAVGAFGLAAGLKLAAIGVYVLAAAAAASVQRHGAGRGWGEGRCIALLLGVEAALLAAFALLGARLHPWDAGGGAPAAFLVASCSTLAMGIQFQTLCRIGGHSFRTTMMTGNMAALAGDLLDWLGADPGADRALLRRRVAVGAALVATFALGVMAAALIAPRLGFHAAWLPVALLVGVAALVCRC